MGYNLTQFMHKCGLRPAVAFSIVVLHCIFPFEITMLEDSSVHVLHLCVNMTPRTSLESLGEFNALLSVKVWIATNS
jgi:hypothetical protein